jgi:hypothetical protein
MQRAVFAGLPGEAKPGGSGLLWQPPLASADSIDSPPAAALPMNRRMTLLERFIAGSVSSLLALVLDEFSRRHGGKAGGPVFQSARGCSIIEAQQYRFA